MIMIPMHPLLAMKTNDYANVIIDNVIIDMYMVIHLLLLTTTIISSPMMMMTTTNP